MPNILLTEVSYANITRYGYNTYTATIGGCSAFLESRASSHSIDNGSFGKCLYACKIITHV